MTAYRRLHAALLLLPLLTLSLNAQARPHSYYGGFAMSNYGEKTIVVNPRTHTFEAYDATGRLVRSGIASTGKPWCPDIQSPCFTHTGSYRIYHMEGPGCVSARFPIPTGGAPMPYCMYFNGNQALHGSYEVGRANLSHGCVRLHVNDARWLRYNFVEGPNSSNGYRGTLVTILPY